MKKNLILTILLGLFLGITYVVKEWWPQHHAPPENWVFTAEELKSFTQLDFGQSSWHLVGQNFYLRDSAAANDDAFKMDDELGRQMALILGHLKIKQVVDAALVAADEAAFMGGGTTTEGLPLLHFTAQNPTTMWQLTLGRQLNYADSFYLKICRTEKNPPAAPACQYVVAADEAPLDTYYAAAEAHRTPVKYLRLRRLFNAAPGVLLNHQLPGGGPRASYVYFPVEQKLLGQGPQDWPVGPLTAQRYGRYGKLEGIFIPLAPALPLYELNEEGPQRQED